MEIHSLTFIGFHPCAALRNQNVYIGADPVGHSCFKPGKHRVEIRGVTFLLCDECHAFLLKHPDKIDPSMVDRIDAPPRRNMYAHAAPKPLDECDLVTTTKGKP